MVEASAPEPKGHGAIISHDRAASEASIDVNP
jgi:hypothetical protein